MSRLPKLDLVTQIYLGTVILCGIVYTGLGLTPSSYGIVLAQIGAPEEGPISAPREAFGPTSGPKVRLTCRPR